MSVRGQPVMSNPEEWKKWEGRVDGKFPLRQWLGGSEQSAVFLTERTGQPDPKVVIKLIVADQDADRQLAHWRAAAQLSHPHLMRIYEAGRCRLDGTPLLYLVMEYAEEDLSQILPQRPLAPAEVTELLPALLDSLSYLHGKGFVHGRIKPSNVHAMGDELKLSADRIASSAELNPKTQRRDVYDAPEMAAGIISPAGDVWSIGVTLIAALTQNVVLEGETARRDPDPPAILPAPFRGIARECLHLDPKRRCSIAEIQARLQPAARSVPAEPAALAPSRRPVKLGPIAAGALVVALLTGLVIFFSRSRSASAPATTTQPAAPTAGQSAPTSAPEPPPSAAAKPPTPEPIEAPKKGASSPGEVLHQALPDVSKTARNTITGTVKVGVRVEVDSSGKVTVAKLASPGPSKYFAGLALKAAQGWEFSPPEVDGRATTSTWLIQFRFKRNSTEASPERVRR
jgi:TonB family protein